MKKIVMVFLGVMLLLNGIITQPVIAAENPFALGYIEGYLKNIIVDYPTEPSSSTKTGKSVAATKAATAQTPGTIKTTLEIEDYEGSLYQIELSQTAALTIDQIPVNIGDFRPGIEIYGDIQGKKLISLQGYSTASLGYITPGSKTQQGTVKKIDRDQIQILLANGKTITAFTTPATIVQRKGLNIPLGSLYTGDRVKLFFDEVGSSIIGRIQIEGDSVEIKNIYLATLQGADRVEDTISLENIQVLTNGTWQDYKPSMKVPYNSKTPLYVGAQKVAYQNLKYYQGKQVYMAIRNLWGKDYVEKMIVKSQYESNYNDKIESVNLYAQAFELQNHQNISFNEGTIVIKDGRLVDTSLINQGSDAMVVADGRIGTKNANLVCILNDGINNSNISQNQIYAGKLNQLTENSLWFNSFFVLNANQWESFSDNKELLYDRDTSVYDLENAKLITNEEFLSGDYVSSESANCWYSYLYTDGDRIVAATVQKASDSLLRQRISSGIIASLTDDASVGWTIEMRESRDWSSRNSQWMLRDSNIRFNLDKALLVKNNKLITAEDLQIGDRLYVVRDDFQGKVVIVK